MVAFQDKVGLDLYVHGEPERNDMVQYFGELLSGFVFTQNGWVQSYGSRYVDAVCPCHTFSMSIDTFARLSSCQMSVAQLP